MKKWKISFLNSWVILIIFALIVIVIEIVVFFMYPNEIEKVSKILMVAISLVAILFGWKQLRANHDWNRRSLTLVQLNELIEKLRKYRMELDN